MKITVYGIRRIEDFIEYWHTHETGNSLREFLGMTKEEYTNWLKGEEFMHINHEEWIPCKECMPNCSWCKNNWENTRKVSIDCFKCKDYSNYKPEYKYCYECGRPLTEEAWKELEEKLGAISDVVD